MTAYDMNTPSNSSRRRFLTRSGAMATASVAGVFNATGASSAAEPTAKRTPLVDPAAGLAGIKELLAGKHPVIWLFTGDSITHGALHTLGWRSYPEHFAERVRWELRRVRDVVINTGISGDTTKGILGDLDWRVLQFQPQVVSLMFGMNDCSKGPDGREPFRQNLVSLVGKIQAAGAVPVLNTPNTVYVKNAGGRGDLPAYSDIVREVATQSKIALVDHWAHWQKTKPDQETLLPWVEDKSIHPGNFGHREFAKLIFREFGIYDDKSPTCLLEVP